jgi:ribose transport system permease protein
MTEKIVPGTAAAEVEAEVAAEAQPDPESAGSSRRRALDLVRGNPVVFTFLALIVIMIVFSMLQPGKFNTTTNFSLLAQNVAILTVVSVGTTFVIITGGVDLSIPSGIVLGEVFAVKFLSFVTVADGTAVDVAAEQTKASYLLVGLAGALLAGLAIGAVNGVLVGYMRIPPLLATLGTLGTGLGVAELLQNGVNVATYALNPVTTGHVVPGVPNLITIAAVVVVLGAVLLHQSVFGRHTYAIGSNPEAARRVGLKVERHLLRVYLLGGLASGLAGYLSVAFFSTTSIAGHTTDNLQAITAVAIGGTSLFGGIGTVVGSLIGVWIPAVLKNGFVITGVQPYWQDIALGPVLVLAVWLDQLRRRSRDRR